MNYLVSIIVPVYNAEKYLNRCLNTLLSQTYTDIEILIIDDGSNDNSLEILKEYSDNRIKVYAKENTGVSSARNIGIEKSNGEYILFVDADDYVNEDMVKELIKEVDDLYSLIFCDNYEIWEKGIDRRSLFEMETGEIDRSVVLREVASGRAGLVCSKLVSKRVIHENNIRFNENIKISEDQIFFLEVVEKITKFKYINKSLYYYDRRNEESATIKYQENLLNNFTCLQKIIEDVFERNNLKSEEDKILLNNRKINFIWLCINNEVKYLKFINIKIVVNNIENLLKKSINYIDRDKVEYGRINNLIMNSLDTNNNRLASIKLIVMIQIFNFKMRFSNREYGG